MANTREHRHSVSVTWKGNLGSGTSGYRDYSRDYEIGADGKAVIHGSRTRPFEETGSTPWAKRLRRVDRGHSVVPFRGPFLTLELPFVTTVVEWSRWVVGRPSSTMSTTPVSPGLGAEWTPVRQCFSATPI